MAKNLKLNVKNAQLAEALKLGNIKKPAVKKKKLAETTAEETPHAEEKKVAPSITPVVPSSEPPAKPTKAVVEATSEIKEPTTAKETPTPVSEKPQAPIHPRTPIPPSAPAEPSASGLTSESYSAPRTEGYTSRYQDLRAQQGSYPPRRQEGGYSSQGSQSGQGYPPRRQEGGGYPPRREGGYSSQGGQGYPPRRQEGGYPPRREGGYSSQGGAPQGNQGYPPHQQGGYPPRREGGYSSQSGAPQGGQGYPPRQQGGYPPRREGGYSPQGGAPQSGQGYPPRQQGGYPPRQGYSSEGSAGQSGYRPGGAPPFRRPPGAGYTPGGARPPYPSGPRPFQPGQPGGYGSDTRRPFAPRGPVLTEESKGDRKVRTFTDEPRKLPPKDFREHKQPIKRSEAGSFDARDRQGLRGNTEEQGWRKKRPTHKMRPLQQEEIIRPKTLAVKIPVTIKDLASEMKLKASQLIAKLFMKGIVLTLNDFIDDETTIQLLGHDFDCEITIDRMEENRLRITDKTIKEEIQESPAENLVLRAPVVAFMGHVDHGKTSLIDKIRTSDIAGDEAGAITQHIGAFKCHTAVGDITILDTPGHEAFSAMRARGADVTDIIVLVIAGDEGIRTQTIEAITQAQTANVPILVALNKCDKPNFNPENVYRQLSENNLLPEPWGGQTIVVNCSAVTGEGIKELLEMLALQAEVLELKANPNLRARGSVIESEMHKGMGAVATILVQNGTLRLGDSLVFSHQFARIKTMHNEHDKELTEAGPSTPVKITGLSALPEAGSEFIVVKNEKEAMEIAEKRTEGKRHSLLHQAKRGAESFLAEKATGIKKKVLNLIIRGDVQGSVEALKNSLLKITSDKIDLNIISASVGEISESDVQLASASKATILGFHTQIESHAEGLIKALKVTIKLHDVIYHAVDEIRAIMLSMLDKVAKETDIGSAEIRATFKSSHLGIIAGCTVLDGTIKRSSHVRQLRDNKVIWKGPLHSLKRVKEDVKEVSKGYECGIVLQNNNDVKVGDILQAFEITYLEQEL